MREIKLSRGKIAIVDDQDYEWLNEWKWSFDGGYAQRVGDGKHIRLHRILLKIPKGKQVDHINRNKLDNRRINLRIVTHWQNRYNRPPEKDSTSIYKGVHWHKISNKWKVEIGFEKNKNLYIGTFTSEFHAAMAYDLWARDLYGEFAYLNFGKADCENKNP